jgi:hypothetical protein
MYKYIEIKPYVLEEAYTIWEGILIDQKNVKGKVQTVESFMVDA